MTRSGYGKFLFWLLLTLAFVNLVVGLLVALTDEASWSRALASLIGVVVSLGGAIMIDRENR